MAKLGVGLAHTSCSHTHTLEPHTPVHPQASWPSLRPLLPGALLELMCTLGPDRSHMQSRLPHLPPAVGEVKPGLCPQPFPGLRGRGAPCFPGVMLSFLQLQGSH